MRDRERERDTILFSALSESNLIGFLKNSRDNK
jgi:hypothetical protein